VLCAVLAAVCAVVPEIEERLKEALPGRGRLSTSAQIAGATQAFCLAPGLPDAAKQELAWSSFSLLKNTNSCGVVVVSDGKVLMARGALGQGVVVAKQAEQTLANMSRDLSGALASCSKEMGAAAAGGSRQPLYLPDRGSMSRVSAQSWASLPAGAESLLVQPISTASGKQAALLLFSERPRALSDRERSWAAAIANKLSPVIG